MGGQRSGKSRYAEQLVAKSLRAPVYVATATAGDGEMMERIERHRARRSEDWLVVEEPVDIAERIVAVAAPSRAILVECLTLWVSNLLATERDPGPACDKLLGALESAAGPVVLVSNEVGAGVIPANALARRYADTLGTLNQRVAAAVGRVVLMSAGIPLLIKPTRLEEVRL